MQHHVKLTFSPPSSSLELKVDSFRSFLVSFTHFVIYRTFNHLAAGVLRLMPHLTQKRMEENVIENKVPWRGFFFVFNMPSMI